MVSDVICDDVSVGLAVKVLCHTEYTSSYHCTVLWRGALPVGTYRMAFFTIEARVSRGNGRFVVGFSAPGGSSSNDRVDENLVFLLLVRWVFFDSHGWE